MITPSFNLTATERVLPRLALDFTTASLDSRVTFTRTGNTATVVNSSGLVAPINANLPRFDFDPITLACKGLLIEEARTNLILQSGQIQTSPWAGTYATTVGNAITALDGTLTGTKINETSVNAVHIIIQPFTTTAVTYTATAYLKAAERTWGTMQIDRAGTNATYFDLVNGVVGNLGTGTTATISNAGNGWWRCSVTRTLTVSLWYVCIGTATANGTQSFTGDVTKGIYAWGAQLEIGAKETSYIPTEAVAVTRNADVGAMTGTNFSSWYNATEGGAVVQVLPSTISGTRPAVQFDDNTANESITLRGVAADPQLFVVDGGATQATLDAGTIAANTLYKLGGAWKDASYAVALNGAAPVTQASGTFPTATQARLGSDGTNYLNGHLQSLRFWPQRLTNAEVQAFSK